MTYQTNAIGNRLGLSLGWLDTKFPVSLLHYPGRVQRWIKLYLLIKYYLLKKNIRLLSFRLRSNFYPYYTEQAPLHKLTKSFKTVRSLQRFVAPAKVFKTFFVGTTITKNSIPSLNKVRLLNVFSLMARRNLGPIPYTYRIKNYIFKKRYQASLLKQPRLKRLKLFSCRAKRRKNGKNYFVQRRIRKPRLKPNTFFFVPEVSKGFGLSSVFRVRFSKKFFFDQTKQDLLKSMTFDKRLPAQILTSQLTQAYFSKLNVVSQKLSNILKTLRLVTLSSPLLPASLCTFTPRVIFENFVFCQ